MEWNYYNTFITVAADCPNVAAAVPPDKKSGKTKAGIEYELISENPYGYTQEELLFATHIRHKEISEEELTAKESELRDEFFGKPKACLRASALPKKYGWGLHFNAEGKIALFPMESPEYRNFVDGRVDGVKVILAMRNSR